MSILKLPVVVFVTFRTTMQRTLAATRIDLGPRFLERICDRMEERAEASWSALGVSTSPPAEETA